MPTDVLLLGEELAPGTSPDDVSGIGQGRGPVKARSEGFSHEGRGTRMVGADTRVDIAKELDSFILCSAFAQGS